MSAKPVSDALLKTPSLGTNGKPLPLAPTDVDEALGGDDVGRTAGERCRDRARPALLELNGIAPLFGFGRTLDPMLTGRGLVDHQIGTIAVAPQLPSASWLRTVTVWVPSARAMTVAAGIVAVEAGDRSADRDGHRHGSVRRRWCTRPRQCCESPVAVSLPVALQRHVDRAVGRVGRQRQAVREPVRSCRG